MADSFDAFHEWLGIAPKDQPPNHYRLLGIELYEAKANVIDGAADRQMAHLRTFQTGARSKLCQELLNQVSAARVTLLDAEKKAVYDVQLEKQLAGKRAEPQPQTQPRVAQAIPLSRPAAPAAASAPQISGTPSHRRAHRKQSTPWLALGIGGSLLGIVVVIAAISMMGGGGETAESPPAAPSENAGADSGNKSDASTASASPKPDPAKSQTDEPPTKESSDATPEDDPSSDDDAKESPTDDPSDDDVIPFKVAENDDPSPDDRLPNKFAPPGKAAIPDQAALAKAEAEVHEIFTGPPKARLARELLATAKDEDDYPAAQYVLLRLARDMSAEYGDYATAERAIGEMSQRFDVDAIAMRGAALVQALAAKTSPAQRQRIARDALRIVGECHEADRYRESKAIVNAVLRAASRLKDKQMAADARRLRDDGAALAKQYAAVRGAFETLETKPDDPAANATAGKYLCFVKGGWTRGLAMLVKGNDKSLKDLASREQRGADTLAEQLAVADAWWDVAEAQPSHTRSEVRIHAAHGYHKALTKLSGLDKLRVQKRLDQAAAAGWSALETPKVPVSSPDLPDEKPIATLLGHTNPVPGVRFLADGKTVVSCSQDKTLRLWNVKDGETIRTLRGHQSQVRALSVSADGKMIVSSSYDKTVKLWNAATGELLYTLTGHSAAVKTVDVSPDGATIVSGSLDQTVRLWDAKTGKQKAVLTGHSGDIRCVRFSPDGKTIASVSYDLTIRFWDAATGKEKLSVKTLRPYCAAFSHDGKTLAVGTTKNLITLIDVATGKTLKTLTGHTGSVLCVVFSPDDKRLASGSNDTNAMLWDLSTGKPLATFRASNSATHGIDFSPDGKLLVTSSWGRSVRLWNVPEVK